MLLTAEFLHRALAEGRTLCGQVVAARPPGDRSRITLFMQNHPDGPDGVVAQDEYLAWARRQPEGATLALELMLELPLMSPAIAVYRDGGSELESFTEDGPAVSRYLELAATLLAPAL